MKTDRNWLDEAFLDASELAFRLAHLSESQVTEVLEYLKDQWEAQQEARGAEGAGAYRAQSESHANSEFAS